LPAAADVEPLQILRATESTRTPPTSTPRKHATGGTNGRAPIGYVNYGRWFEGREVRTVKVDEDRFELVQMAFRMYATGQYSISELTEILDGAGLKTRMTRKRPEAALSRSAVHHMLGNAYYVGIVTRCGVEARGGACQAR
jgi:site-specific DNA recombinase